MLNFLKYYFNRPLMPNGEKMWFPGNYQWTVMCLIFIIAFLCGHAPVFYILCSWPMLMLTYNVHTEWNKYKQNGVGGKLMAKIYYGLCLIILLTVIIILFYYKTN
jgi:hypothetical protein